MSKDTELIDSRVSVSQCKHAVEALVAHEKKKEEEREKTELIPGKEPNVWLVVAVKTMRPTSRLKPLKIPIAHPLVDPRMTPICLITKDPQREYKDLLESHGIKFISRVIGIAKLKGKFKPFEARRMLLKENDFFLADERVIPLLPKLLGSKWFEAKKQPIPVCLTRKDLKAELERAISSTYMHQNQGTCTSVKIGKLSQKSTQILENIKIGLPAIVKGVKDGWDNIQSLFIKTNSSVSLPIWTCALDDAAGGRWAGLTARADDQQEEGSDEGSDDEEAIVEKRSNTKKGKRRVTENEEREEQNPKKKLKGIANKGSSPPLKIVSKTKNISAKSESQPPSNSTKPKSLPAPSKVERPKSHSLATDSLSKPQSNATSGITKKISKRKMDNHDKTPELSSKASSLSKEQLKAKLAVVGGKKKHKTLSLKAVKSAKHKLLGKKAAKA